MVEFKKSCLSFAVNASAFIKYVYHLAKINFIYISGDGSRIYVNGLHKTLD